ncbi:hypothetical protein ACSSV1_000169 [Labrenzia sp. MBR-25]
MGTRWTDGIGNGQVRQMAGLCEEGAAAGGKA